MVEGPGCKVKGEKLQQRVRGQTLKNVGDNTVHEHSMKKKQANGRSEAGQSCDRATAFQRFVGKMVIDVKTLGKELFIFFDDVTMCIRVHFLMSGGFKLNGKNTGEDRDVTDRPTLQLSLSIDELTFHKCAVQVQPVESVMRKLDNLTELDICSSIFNKKRAVDIIRQQTGRPLCDVLLDQQILPGVGNIIKNEAFFDSGMRPDLRVEDLSETEISHLVKMTRDFSMLFYKCRKEGKSLQPYLKIYRKSECKQCGGKVTTTRMGDTNDRLTCFCPSCQTTHISQHHTRILPKKNSLLGWISGGCKEDQQNWACDLCTLINKHSRVNCSACLSPRHKSSPSQAASNALVKSLNAYSLTGSAPKRQKLNDHGENNSPLLRSQENVQSFHGNINVLGQSTCVNDNRKLNVLGTAVKNNISENVLEKSPPVNVANSAASQTNTLSSQQKITIKIPTCRDHQKPCALRRVHKKGVNQYRVFWSCPVRGRNTCQYFQWADEDFPTCSGHGKRCVLRSVLKEGSNNGRAFFACSADRKKTCNYFEWADHFTVPVAVYKLL